MNKATRPSTGKFKFFVVFAASLALVVFSAFAFVNNVSVVVKWWGAFLASNGDAAALDTAVSGVFPWFDWSAVDYSCVSTFIPFSGFLLCCIGLLRILRGKDCSCEYFPFFRTSDQLNISFGLIGTLWGIIVIGYYNIETVRMADLMSCLHTALFSTLVAVVWVFVVDHPMLRPLFRSLALDAGLVHDEDEDIVAVLDNLKSAAGELRTAWAAEQAEFDNFSTRLKSAGCDIESLGLLGRKTADFLANDMSAALTSLATKLDSMTVDIERRQNDFNEAMTSRLASLDEAFALRLKNCDEACAKRMEAFDEAVAKRIAAIDDTSDKRLKALESSQMKMSEVIAESSGVIASTKEALQSLMETLSATAAENTRLRADSEQLSRDKLRLESDLRDTMSQVRENNSRADKAEQMLSKIRAAFTQD